MTTNYLTVIDIPFIESPRISSQASSINNDENLYSNINSPTKIQDTINKDIYNIIYENYINEDTSMILIRFNLSLFPVSLIDGIYNNYLKHLQILDISYCNIIELNTCIYYLFNLKELNLSSNLIEIIPYGINKLKKLKKLNLGYNKLKNLSSDITDLILLEDLDISFNDFYIFPTEILKIVNLKNLFLCGNNAISSLPNIKLFGKIENINIHLYDHPFLLDEYEQIYSKISNVKFIWNYKFPSKITDNLYLSGLSGVLCKNIYEQLDIKSVFTIGKKLNPIITNNMYHNVSEIDDEITSILSLDVIDIIHEQIQKGNKCIVHCQKGISRSASIVIAYMMKYNNMRLNDAYNFIKNKRDCIEPNYGFWEQLIKFDNLLFPDVSKIDFTK
jgi:Leucine-rich repeat (LRR) protein